MPLLILNHDFGAGEAGDCEESLTLFTALCSSPLLSYLQAFLSVHSASGSCEECPLSSLQVNEISLMILSKCMLIPK